MSSIYTWADGSGMTLDEYPTNPNEHCFGLYVHAEDYDALAARLAERDEATAELTRQKLNICEQRDEARARLAEAERLLRKAIDRCALCESRPRCKDCTKAKSFLRASDSAPEDRYVGEPVPLVAVLEHINETFERAVAADKEDEWWATRGAGMVGEPPERFK